MGASEDDEFARIMSRLEELEKEELAAESYGEKDAMNEETSSKYHHQDLTNQLAVRD